MLGPNNPSETGGLQHIPKVEIEGESYGEFVWIKRKVGYRKPAIDECLTGVPKRSAFPLGRAVVDQGVIHVVPNDGHAAKVERTVRKDPSFGERTRFFHPGQLSEYEMSVPASFRPIERISASSAGKSNFEPPR